MRKRILGSFAVIAIATVAVLNVNFNTNDGNNKLSTISLANVEALAQGENGTGNNPCYKGTYNGSLPTALKCSLRCDEYDRVGGEIDKC